MEYVIRRYESQDFEDCDYLQRQFYLHPASRDELRGKLENPSWVAVDDESIIGNLITCPDVDRVQIWSIVVASAYRGRGIGAALIDASISFHHDKKLTLYVEPSNVAAKRLYEKCGFRAAQLIPDYYSSGYDAVLMTKRA